MTTTKHLNEAVHSVHYLWLSENSIQTCSVRQSAEAGLKLSYKNCSECYGDTKHKQPVDHSSRYAADKKLWCKHQPMYR